MTASGCHLVVTPEDQICRRSGFLSRRSLKAKSAGYGVALSLSLTILISDTLTLPPVAFYFLGP
jgi:hypothetical protein